MCYLSSINIDIDEFDISGTNGGTSKGAFIHELVHLMGYDEFQAFSVMYSANFITEEKIKQMFEHNENNDKINYLFEGSGLDWVDYASYNNKGIRILNHKSRDEISYHFSTEKKLDEFLKGTSIKKEDYFQYTDATQSIVQEGNGSLMLKPDKEDEFFQMMNDVGKSVRGVKDEKNN